MDPNTIPFLSVIGATFLAVGVPTLSALLFMGLVALSFWPVVVVLVTLGFFGFVSTASLVLIWWMLAKKHFLKTMRTLRLWTVFLLPFHGIVAVIVALCLSFYWGLAIGACVFLHGEVLWPSSSVPARKQWFVDVMERVVAPIFDYFPIKVVRDRAYAQHVGRDDGKRVIYGYHPHGIYAFGLFSLLFPNVSGFSRVFSNNANANGGRSSNGRKDGPSLLLGVASALLHVPVAKYLFSSMGFVSASRQTLEKVCASSAYDLALIPGGIAEMLLTSSRPEVEEIVYLKRRRGFVRLAIKHNRKLIPIFAFGESRTFTPLTSFRELREAISRRFRVSLQLFHGRWFTLIPYRSPITVVVGLPIDPEDVRKKLEAQREDDD
eukprot:g2782.t1